MSSVVSESDLQIFQALSNTEAVDTKKATVGRLGPVAEERPNEVANVPSGAAASSDEDDEEDDEEDEDEDEDDDDDDDDEDDDSYSSVAAPRASAALPTVPPPTVAPPTVLPTRRVPSSASSATSVRRRKNASAAATPFDAAVHYHRMATPTPLPAQPAPAPPVGAISAPSVLGGGYRRNAEVESEDTILSKQSALLDLDRLKLRGVKLTREYSLSDPLDDIEFELKRHLAHIEEDSTVKMLRDFMRIGCTGVELVNSKIGLLELEGWSAEVCADIGRYDHAFAGLYKKYWRRSQSSPEMQIVMGLAGSVGLFHLKKKFLGGGSDGAQSSAASPMAGLGNLANMFSGIQGMGSQPRSAGRPNTFAAYESSDDEAAPP